MWCGNFLLEAFDEGCEVVVNVFFFRVVEVVCGGVVKGVCLEEDFVCFCGEAEVEELLCSFGLEGEDFVNGLVAEAEGCEEVCFCKALDILVWGVFECVEVCGEAGGCRVVLCGECVVECSEELFVEG